MHSNCVIRPEKPDDCAEITKLINQAFFGMPYSEGDEALLVQRLREQGNLAVSLVAESRGVIVGHIAFSPAYPANDESGWFALGPLAVMPDVQRKGVGSLLVQNGLATLAGRAARGCVLVGHLDYYARFGFVPAPLFASDNESTAYFMMKSFAGMRPTPPISFHPAFYSGC